MRWDGMRSARPNLLMVFVADFFLLQAGRPAGLIRADDGI